MFPNLAAQPDAAANAEIEALQTDIMRFFAIVCLCLLAIFAAVSGTPSSSQSEQAAVNETLRTELHSAQLQASDLAAQVDALQQQLSVKENAEQSLAEQLERARVQVTLLEQAQVEEPLPEPDVTPELPPATKQQRPEPVETDPIETVEVEEPEREGFSLSFANDAAFRQLLNTPSLRLIGTSGERAWSVNFNGSAPSVASAGGITGYPLANGTVPPDVLTQAEKVIGQSVSRWSIWLDPALDRALKERMQQRKGGDLLLQSDGSIVFKE